MRASVALPSSADLVTSAREGLGRIATHVERRRWWIVGACIVVQWALLAYEAFGLAHHNGWLYQHGDDGPWYWTSAWALSSLHVPFAAVGMGWPYLLTPLAAIFGPDMANGLPAVVALNVLVLAPACVVGMYLIGERIAGRLFGVWTAALWVALPVVALLLYNPHARHFLQDAFLPTASGLNALADFPSEAFAIFAAYLILRTLDSGDLRDGALLGLALGFLLLVKPANAPLVLVAAIVLLLGRRWRPLVATGVAAIPVVLALALWKRTGVGQAVAPAVPSSGGAHAGPSPQPGAAPHPGLLDRLNNLIDRAYQAPGKYVHINVHHLGQITRGLSELFWSFRLLEFLLVAGAVGLVARGRLRGLTVVAWFLAYAIVKGTVSYASVFDTSLYRFLLPAWPAWILIVSGVVFCWPVGAARQAERRKEDAASARSVRGVPTGAVAAAAVVLALGPLVLAALASPVRPDTTAQMNYTGAPVPVVEFGFEARRAAAPHTVLLTWSPLTTRRAHAVYRIFRTTGNDCTPISLNGAPTCRFKSTLLGWSAAPIFRDEAAHGRLTYRVALAAGARFDANATSDLLLLSKPVTIAVP